VANHYPSGARNVALPEQNQPSWRPEDEPMAPGDERRRNVRRTDDERDDRAWRGRGPRDDREYDRGPGRHGDERWRLRRWPEHDRERNAAVSPGSFEDRYRDDDRSRGGYWLDRAGDLGPAESYRGRDFGPERRELARGHRQEERTGYPAGYGRGDERLGYPAGSYSRRGSWMGGESQRGSAAEGRTEGHGEGHLEGHLEGHMHRGIGPHRGKGPSGYQRSDERIRELVCESLTEDDQIDASHLEVSVSHGEVTLSGTVEDRRAKREAEDCAYSVTGVRDVQNLLRVDDGMLRSNRSSAASVGTSENGRERELGTAPSKHRA
jgi:osmotically-inducible protein OsmY